MTSSYKCMKPLFGLLVFLCCMLAGCVCRAQLSITLDTATVSFGTLSKADLDTGFMELTASDLTYALRVTITDTAPQNWTLHTRASTASFTAALGVKPCSDLQWRPNGTGNYTAYTVTDAAAATGIGNVTSYFDFKMITSWADKPDTYNVDVVFTISYN